jgi:hypothetical protein
MRKLLLAIALAASAAPASAQIAAAIGKPLPSQDFPVGTVSVRVVAGNPSSPVEGTDVTLVVNGTPRAARTDSEGRVFFKDLPAGATVQAKTLDADKKETASEEFSLPDDRGVRLMLSTKPWNPGAGAGMAGGGAPDPIDMSGEPRAEPNDPAGQFTVLLTYDDFKDTAAGVPVSLVAYHADDSIEVITKPSDKDGRAQFSGLDRSGGTSYFALAQLPRNRGVDRLESSPVTLDGRAGIRLILSSHKRTSGEPPLNEVSLFDKQDPAPPEGKVRVTLEGVPPNDPITLYSLTSGGKRTVVGKAVPTIGAPDPREVTARPQFSPNADLPAGTVDVKVHGGAGSDNNALPDVSVRIVKAAAAKKNDFTGAVESKTPESGSVRIALAATEPVVAMLTINGKDMMSPPFNLAKGGGTLDVEAHWPSTGKPEAVFDVAPDPNQVLFAETSLQLKGEMIFHSAPFQAVAGRGTHVTLFVLPRVWLRFILSSQLDDRYLVIGGQFAVTNNSWAPYVAGKDGMLLPMPKGFRSAEINQDDQNDVGIVEGQGFRFVAPIPPFGRQFHAQFALPVEGGKVSWDMELPYGLFQSEMDLMHVPGSEVHTPDNVERRLATADSGQEFVVLQQISILPNQRMTLSIDGLPAEPAWRVWVPRVVGGFVVLMMAGGLGLALVRRARRDVTRESRRRALLDELVELERTNKDKPRRDAILSELEALWGDSTS